MSAPRGRKPSHVPAKTRTPPGVVLDLEPPEDMSEDAAAVWATVVPELCQKSVLVPEDAPLLVEFVESLALARRCRRAMVTLLERPWLAGIEVGRDELEQMPPEVAEALALASPAIKRLRSGYIDALSRASSLASCFGLTPTDRIRLGISAGRDGGESLRDVLAAALRDAFRDGSTEAKGSSRQGG